MRARRLAARNAPRTARWRAGRPPSGECVEVRAAVSLEGGRLALQSSPSETHAPSSARFLLRKLLAPATSMAKRWRRSRPQGCPAAGTAEEVGSRLRIAGGELVLAPQRRGTCGADQRRTSDPSQPALAACRTVLWTGLRREGILPSLAPIGGFFRKRDRRGSQLGQRAATPAEMHGGTSFRPCLPPLPEPRAHGNWHRAAHRWPWIREAVRVRDDRGCRRRSSPFRAPRPCGESRLSHGR